MNKESRLSTAQISVIIIGIAIIVFAVILAVEDNNVSRNFDAMSAQIEELSEGMNAEEGLSIAESSSYTGVLEAVIVQATEYKVSHYVVVGGRDIKVSEMEYLKAKDNIGRLVAVETKRKKARRSDGEYLQTYDAVVTYEDDAVE